MRKCSDCGGDLKFGDWPFCNGDPQSHVPAPNFGEEPIEPYVDWQLSSNTEDEPEITTRGQRRQIMRENGLEYRKVPKIGKVMYFDQGR